MPATARAAPEAIITDAKRISERNAVRCPAALRSSRIAVDDDLLAEGAVGVQNVGQARAGDQNAEDDQSGGAQQTHQQHWKYADQEDRQQRQHNE